MKSLRVALVALSLASSALAAEPGADPGSAGSVLAACEGRDCSFCSGYTEAAFGASFADSRICPPSLQADDVERVLVDALRAVPEDSAAILAAADAFAEAWPCTHPVDDPSAATAALTAAAGRRSFR